MQLVQVDRQDLSTILIELPNLLANGLQLVYVLCSGYQTSLDFEMQQFALMYCHKGGNAETIACFSLVEGDNLVATGKIGADCFGGEDCLIAKYHISLLNLTLDGSLEG